MSLAFKYIGLKYLKSFLIVFLSLLIFFVSMDIMAVFNKLPSSAGLKLLYILNSAHFQATIIVPLAILFGFVLFVLNLIKNNIFTAIYSVGLSKIDLMKPVFFIAFAITSLMLVTQSTQLAYAEDVKKRILKGTYFDTQKDNIFLKYDDFFVYFGKLYPLQKKATNIKIFKIIENKLIYEIEANTATYKNNAWILKDVKTIIQDKENGLKIIKNKSKTMLEGFKPKIMDKVYEVKNRYSIIDAIDTYSLLRTQNIDTNAIRASFYWSAILPFFVLCGIVLIFSYISTNARFFDKNLFVLSSLGFSIFLWGVLFFLYKLSSSNKILPELSLLLPFILLNVITIWIYNNKKGNL